MTYSETGQLTLWQLDELTQILQEEDRAQKRAASRTDGPGDRRIPVMT